MAPSSQGVLEVIGVNIGTATRSYLSGPVGECRGERLKDTNHNNKNKLQTIKKVEMNLEQI
jgi:hypothetical protein